MADALTAVGYRDGRCALGGTSRGRSCRVSMPWIRSCTVIRRPLGPAVPWASVSSSSTKVKTNSVLSSWRRTGRRGAERPGRTSGGPVRALGVTGAVERVEPYFPQGDQTAPSLDVKAALAVQGVRTRAAASGLAQGH